MLLGALLERLRHSVDASAALEALGDVVLFARIDEMAGQFEESPGEYVAASASRFAALAGDEDWLDLMSAIERSQDPAQAVVVKMLNWALARDAQDLSDGTKRACGCGGGHAGVSHGSS